MTKSITKHVLITVKATPNPSKKYQETNCCAGIDLNSGQLIRLYPIPFRLLDDSKKFTKYTVIKVSCQKPLRDKRVESYKVDQDSIQIMKQLNTKNKWAKRKEIILPAISLSFCQIIKDIKLNRSLGIFKPSNVEFSFKKASLHNTKKVEAPYKQYRLFDRQLKPLEQIPFSFYYKFNCYNEPKCKGHKLSIHDWEITEAYRRWRSRYPDQTILIQKIQEKWMYMCGPEKDVYFFVGNIWRRPKQFMVLGIFYPTK
ncbi:MAG: hypothetical protein JW715_16585 [Sedimentisphaerales bacterium]|nr:hypothetical protein [Sedimentisphaerales bacterium]